MQKSIIFLLRGENTLSKLKFPKPFVHEHAAIQNVNELLEEQFSFGERAADWIANFVGTWKFIIGQSIILTFWVILNVAAWMYHWDPYPFILMNLTLSLQAAYTAPLIMMSQKRQSGRDRLEAHQDFLLNKKAEKETHAILKHLAAQDQALDEIHKMLADQQN